MKQAAVDALMEEARDQAWQEVGGSKDDANVDTASQFTGSQTQVWQGTDLSADPAARELQLMQEIFGEEAPQSLAELEALKAAGGDSYQQMSRACQAVEAVLGGSGEGKPWNLSSDLQRTIIKWETGFSNCRKGDLFAANARKIPPKAGFFDVVMHGTPYAIGFGLGPGELSNMTARQLATVIRHMGHYKGQKVRLLSCSTGGAINKGINFAQQLANALGVEVEAPTEVLWANYFGDSMITNDKNIAWIWSHSGRKHNTGEWKSFYPGGKDE